MNTTLHALALIYRESAAARGGAVKDFTIDWEKFLRRTNRHDGDARELAEQELLAAERAADGRLVVDRHPRTGAMEVLRLKREDGEAWLFAATGRPSPASERERLIDFFGDGMATVVPDAHATGWRMWCEAMMTRARNGDSVMPFKREDPQGNRLLLNSLLGVLNWSDESLIRYASAVICGDSKALESLQPRLLAALREISCRVDVTLEDFGIFDTPRAVLIHGPLQLELSGGRIDFGMLAGPVAISATDLSAALQVECRARLCLTVENEAVFREIAKRKTGILLVQTSFPGAATRLLFERLPRDVPCCHFGDSDPAGFDILRDVREKTGRQFEPLLMYFRSSHNGPPLTEEERRTIVRLLESRTLSDVHAELQAMLSAGTKGNFEQESVTLNEVLDSLGLRMCRIDAGGNRERLNPGDPG